jgi:DNA-binding MarR family transcriptional regulator
MGGHRPTARGTRRSRRFGRDELNTGRVARLVEEGLLRRANDDADARDVVVALTDAGIARLTETAPVHLRGVSELFIAQLDDHELGVLENALDKVTVGCTFG